MADAENDDLSPMIINPVQNAVGATSGTPDPVQLVAERRANPTRILPKRAGDEVNHRKRDSFRECLSDYPRRWGGYDDFIDRFGHRGRNAFTASTPRTTSPWR